MDTLSQPEQPDQPDNKDRYFKGQQSDEELICFFRHHWITLLREFLYFAIFIFAIILTLSNMTAIKELLQGNREIKMLFLTGFIMTTLYMHRFFIKMLNYFVNIAIVTDIRLIDHQKTLFFKDTMDAIDLAQIQNIEKYQEGIFPSLLGYGDIKIFLNASAAVKTFYGLPNAKFHFRCMNRQKEMRQLKLREHGNITELIHHEIDEIQPNLSPTPTVQTIKQEEKPIPIEK
ncbi:hypothetical protein HY605_01365 [Candidatus Peregrinibacteria bacterium]|nr:hypothetical protein [Candidatus Peregrinibacteria bacterium]